MATLAITIPANSETGAILRRLSRAIVRVSADIPDKVSSGASVVLTVDNSPSVGTASVQITSGPYPSSLVTV
jgi:hypothetical protein